MQVAEILVVKSRHQAGSLARILQVIADGDMLVEGLKTIHRDHRWTTWEITIVVPEGTPLDGLSAQLNALETAEVVGRSDRVFNRHRGGKVRTISTHKVDTDEMLRDLYTPGVARVCRAIQADPQKALSFTSKQSTVAIVTNGTAVLGLGNIGALAGLPVMEGKAALFAELAQLSGVPILIESEDIEKIVETVVAIAPSFGAIQLEDIKAPECFEIERRLRERLDIPVMHDDQHGTAVVTLAAALSATASAGVSLRKSRFGQIGLGAAGQGICELLINYGVAEVRGTDLDKSALDRLATLGGKPCDLREVMAKSDVVVSTTGVKGLIKPEMVREGQVILALSNPEPEIEPEVALKAGAAFATDGKVVNNVLGYPGIFKGALLAGAKSISTDMLIIAAETLSRLRERDALVPDALNRDVHEEVSDAVRRVALRGGR